MKSIFTKFLVFFFILGINGSFSSFYANNLNKNSITYNYLCKSNDNSDSHQKLLKKSCYFCTLENENNNDGCSYSTIDIANIFFDIKNILYYKNFYYSFQINYQKNRSPPILS